MEKKVKLNIKGTKPDVQSSQLLISTGIPDLDLLLGGGLPIGGLIVIEEDLHGSYSRILLKYFLAEGVVNQHDLLVGSLECDPKEDLIDELPGVNTADVDPDSNHPLADDNKMTIAFRYQNLPTREKQIKSEFGHYYDLSKRMSPDQFENIKLNYFTGEDNLDVTELTNNSQYNQLLGKIKDLLNTERHALDEKFDQKNILRICLHQLGTPLYGNDSDFLDLRKFLYRLRSLVRKSFSVAIVTIPAHLSNKLQQVFNQHIVHTSDVVLKFESFAGTKLEKNKYLSDYHGFFHVVKLAAINTLASKHPGSVEYAFKLKKKKLKIEKLHLPADVEEDIKKDSRPTIGCGSSGKHLLEF